MYFCKKNDFSWIHDVIKRNSHLEVVFCEKGALKNGLKAWNFIKKRLQHKCFPVNIVKFLRKPNLMNIILRTAVSEHTLRLIYFLSKNHTITFIHIFLPQLIILSKFSILAFQITLFFKMRNCR